MPATGIETSKSKDRRRRPYVCAGFDRILDTEAESSFDAVTRLCAEYFRADTVLLALRMQAGIGSSRIGVRPCANCRGKGRFERVLAQDGPVWS